MLEEDKLVSISVAHNGSYKDKHSKKHNLPNAVFEPIEKMTIGQKILVLEGEEQEESDKGK